MGVLPVTYEIGMVLIAILTSLAWHGWFKTVRVELPLWRNLIGVIGLAGTTSTFLGVATMLLSHLLRHSHLALLILRAPRPTSVLTFVCALALKKNPRWFALAASVLLYLCFPSEVVA